MCVCTCVCVCVRERERESKEYHKIGEIIILIILVLIYLAGEKRGGKKTHHSLNIIVKVWSLHSFTR